MVSEFLKIDEKQYGKLNNINDSVIFTTSENKVHHSIYFSINELVEGEQIKLLVEEQIRFKDEDKYFPIINNYSSSGNIFYNKLNSVFTIKNSNEGFKIITNSTFINKIRVTYLENSTDNKLVEVLYQGNR